MSQISLKSISGITSITTPAGVDNQFTLHTNNTSQAFKLDQAGNIHIHNHVNTTGVTTASNFKTGTSNVHNVGIEIAGINVLGADTPIGAGSTIYNSGAAVFTGVVTATSFSGSGANLTGIDTDLVSDTSPQLGGTLDTNNQDITFNGAQNVSWDSSAADFIFNDYAKINLGTDKDFKMYQAGNNTILQSDNTSGGVYLQGALVQIGSETGEAGVKFVKDNQIELYYNNTKRFETTNTGAKVTGNLQFASAGQGIDFSASTHASGKQSELLDDYERGSWTPQFFNARTGGTQLTNPSNTQANYVKVGRIVYLHLGVHGLQKNWAGSNTQIFIRGLPYRSYFQHNGHCVRVGYFGGGSMGNDDMNVYANLRQYDTYMELQKSGGAQGRYEALYWSDIHWEGYGNLTCEMVYETDQGV